MTDLLYALMDATDHLMEEGTSDELDWGLVPRIYDDIDGFRTYSTVQPDLEIVSKEATITIAPESAYLQGS
jgi:hypothetical protein